MCETLVYVTVGTGIGVGILQNGKPNVGNFHLEIGHMRIPPIDDFQGICKIHGNCWEGLASGPSIESRWGSKANIIPISHEAWEVEAQLLASGLVNIIANHSPDKIILGGGVMNQRHLFPMIRNNVAKLWNNYTTIDFSNLIIEPQLGNNSGIIGSLALTR